MLLACSAAASAQYVPLESAQHPNGLPPLRGELGDASTTVIELFYVDGGKIGEPELSVFANGRIRAKVGTGAIWGSMKAHEVDPFLNLLLKTDELEKLTTASIQQEIQREAARTGLSAKFENAGNTILRIRTPTGGLQLEAHAVGLTASRFPGAAGIQKLAQTQERLENLRAVTMVGGTETAQQLAGVAAQKLAREGGERLPVSAHDLRMVRSLADGSRYCQFVVRPGPQTGSGWIVSLIEAPGEAPRVSVLPDGPRRQ